MFNRGLPSAARQARALEARALVSGKFFNAVRSLPAAPLNFALYESWNALPAAPELASLRVAVFTAEGREVEIEALWRESLAAAICAPAVATLFDASPRLATAAALLHRLGDALALVALAKSEQECSVRLDAPSRAELCGCESAELAARALRWWCVPPTVAATVQVWRAFGGSPASNPAAAAVYLSHLIALEWLSPELCAPGLVDSVAREMGIAASRLSAVRPRSDVRALLGVLEAAAK
jgi:hypothetical protein